MRGAIVIFLLAILGGTVAASFVALWVDAITAEDLRTLLTLIFTPIIGLVGAATGFYYGGRTGGTQG
jgi:di/tricarboxylate transporter